MTATVSKLPLFGIVFGSLVGFWLLRWIQTTIQHRRFARSRGCQKPKRVPQKDPIVGFDLFLALEDAAGNHRYLDFIHNWFTTVGSTFGINIMTDDMIFTNEPRNIRAVLATQFEDFERGQRRRSSWGGFLGTGIFNADGKEWEHGRALVRPYLLQKQVSDLSMIEKHVSKMIQQLPADGSEVEIQDWLFRLTMDTGSEYFYGKSVDSLDNAEKEVTSGFAWAFDVGMDTVAHKIRMGRFGWMYRDPNYRKACDFCHNYTGAIVRQAIVEAQSRERNEKSPPADAEKGGQHPEQREEKLTFLQTLAQEYKTVSETDMRYQLINVLVASRDTTASLLSSTLFILAHRQDIQAKVRREMAHLEGRPPTWEQLKTLPYLHNVLQEVLRLYPPVPLNIRVCKRDTTLPCGGGPDGSAPVFVPKGKIVIFSVYSAHRRPDIWGTSGFDAEEFHPDRWISATPGAAFLPFSAGPRVCLGKRPAMTEAAYTITRLFQTFSTFEAPDLAEKWTEKLTVTCCVGQGVTVRLGKD